MNSWVIEGLMRPRLPGGKPFWVTISTEAVYDDAMARSEQYRWSGYYLKVRVRRAVRGRD